MNWEYFPTIKEPPLLMECFKSVEVNNETEKDVKVVWIYDC